MSYDDIRRLPGLFHGVLRPVRGNGGAWLRGDRGRDRHQLLLGDLMKATISVGEYQVSMFLTPETEEDKRTLQELANKTMRTHYFSCQGFSYMDPSINFRIWERGSS